jgi:Fe-S cluster biogenesis protein NfuA
MKGLVRGCPSSTATLKHGIENLLVALRPEVTECPPGFQAVSEKQVSAFQRRRRSL